MYITQLRPLSDEGLVIKKIRGKLPDSMTFKPGGSSSKVNKSHALIWITSTLDHAAMCIKYVDESW